MTLRFCEDDFLFYITHAKYFDILCYFIIIFLIILFLLVKNDKFINKFNNKTLKKSLIVLFFGMFVGFLFFLFALLLSSKTFEGCSTKYYQNIYFKLNNSINNKVNIINKSKIIVVGDSRMEFIEDDEDIIKPFNLEFVAKSGMKIKWFKDYALKRVKKILKNDDFNYYIVINMGVNDLNSDYEGDEIAESYFKLYSNLAKNYPNVKIYIMSVNPIYEDKLNIWEPSNKRTNDKIKIFNNTIKKELKKNDLNNLYYCDSYNNLNFASDDGLHYTKNTNKKIINYIVNKCINLE